MSDAADNFYNLLHRRGLIAQATAEPDTLRDRLDASTHGPTAGYIGFDPTADSLHVGSLLPIMLLAHLQRCGHTPVVLLGGATAMIGDPSGKTESRQMLSRSQIDSNAMSIAEQIGRIVRFGQDATGAMLVNNADWLGGREYIDFLREVGPHFSINRMLSMESVQGRLESGGLTFLEFNYMVMQAYDFVHLHQTRQCTLQLGGQDQWGNIVMGIELERRMRAGGEGESRRVGFSRHAPSEESPPGLLGITTPLMTKADGAKFGKTESGNIWLSRDRTPVFEFYQFWRNAADADVRRFLACFTFIPMDEVDELASAEGAAINEAKERLAHEVTRLVHGEDEADAARDAARRAFATGGGDADVTADSIPSDTLDAAELRDGIGLLTLLTRAGLAKSNGEARRLIGGGGVRVHDTTVDDPTLTLTPEHVVDGYVLLRVGKKRLFRYDLT